MGGLIALQGALDHPEHVRGLGMLCASRLAERLGRVDAEFTSRQHKLLSALSLLGAMGVLYRRGIFLKV